MANCLLLLPIWIRFGGLRPHWLTLEAALLVTLFALLPRARWSRVLAWIAALLVLVTTVLLVGESTARMSLNRPLNLYLDLRLVGSVENLLDGILGSGLGWLVLGGVIVLVAALSVGLARGLASVTEPRSGLRPRVPALLLLGVLTLAIPLRWIHPAGVVLGLPVTQFVREQQAQLTRMLEERERFAGEMAAARAEWSGTPRLMEGLEGRDLVLAFVESYGISAIEDERYAPVIGPVLDELAGVAEARELHVATGLFVAPSQGGMSWLGHGTALSGLWLDNQLRYDLMLAGDRPTLVDDMEAAGYRTVAVMPQITMAWPEGRQLGYDRIWTAAEIDYRGPPLNWVTMPDQFTWAFTQRTELTDTTDAPTFVEIGLISSHAPWTPILELEPWDEIGRGEIFERWRDAGESPESLWREGERVREAYARSLRYALSVMTSWVERELDDDVVLIAMGDHQPAPLVTGEGAPRTVPVHVIATDRETIDPFLARGFVEGVRPPRGPEGGEVPPMSVFREWLVTAFTPDLGPEVTQ